MSPPPAPTVPFISPTKIPKKELIIFFKKITPYSMCSFVEKTKKRKFKIPLYKTDRLCYNTKATVYYARGVCRKAELTYPLLGLRQIFN